MEDALPTMSDLRKRLGEPTRYVMDLNEAFDSIGPFDLVVCTATADYLERPMDTLERLALLLHPGGTLLFQVSTRHVDAFLACGLNDLFGSVSYFTYDCLDGPRHPSSITKSLLGSAALGADDTGDLTPGMKTKLVKLGQLEMTTPCELADAQNIYVRCRSRTWNRAALLKTGT